MKFRKKPIVTDAWQLIQGGVMPSWLIEAIGRGKVVFFNGGAAIVTLEGTMTANNGDWIINGVQGELYPCKPDIFAATYEVAE